MFGNETDSGSFSVLIFSPAHRFLYNDFHRLSSIRPAKNQPSFFLSLRSHSFNLVDLWALHTISYIQLYCGVGLWPFHSIPRSHSFNLVKQSLHFSTAFYSLHITPSVFPIHTYSVLGPSKRWNDGIKAVHKQYELKSSEALLQEIYRLERRKKEKIQRRRRN